MPKREILINRAPVLTLWAAVVAERLGHDENAALTLGKALAGLNAQSKGRRLGIYKAPPESPGDKKPKRTTAAKPDAAPLLGRSIPIVRTRQGVRATTDEKAIDPESVQRYLEQKFGEDLADVRQAMRALAKSFSAKELSEIGFKLYEHFRPSVPEGQKGWGAKGILDLDRIRAAK